MIRRLALLACLAPLLVAAAVPTHALGAANHPFLGASFAEKPPYEDACGLAFGPGGLAVSDYYHDAIRGGVEIADESPGDGPCKLEFDPEGDLYVNDYHQDVVRYVGPFTAGGGETIDSEHATGLAVDPAGGDLYVSHRTYISEYEAPVHAGEAPAKTIGLDQDAAYYGVAISDFPATEGYLYVPDAATKTIKIFDPAASTTSPIEEIDGEATPQGAFTYLIDSEVAVDNSPTSPSYGHVFVLDAIGHGLSEHPEAALDEFNSEGDYRGQIRRFSDAEPSGVAIEPGTGDVYVSSGNGEGSAIFTYGPTALAHTLTVKKIGAGAGTLTSSVTEGSSRVQAGIHCGADCAAEFDEGGKVTLSAAPDAHSAFKEWLGAAGCSTATSCEVSMEADLEVQAEFEEPAQQTLTLTETGEGEGTITSEPAAVSCPPTCSEHFAQDRLVTLTANPAPHSRFAGWGGADCDESTATTCQVTMSAAKALSAGFEPIPQIPLAVGLAGAGQGTVQSLPTGISCPGECTAAFDEGSTVTLLAIVPPGSAFAGWSGACSGLVLACEVRMSSAQAVGARFDPLSAPPPAPAPAAPSAPSGAAPPPPPTTAGARLRLGRLTVRGTGATLRLSVSGAGTVLAGGSGLKRAVAHAGGAGALSLSLRLNAAGRRALAKAKQGRLGVKIEISFTPSGAGAPVTATRSVTFSARQGRKHRTHHGRH